LYILLISPSKPLNSGPATIRTPTISYTCQPNDFKCVSHPHTCIRSNMVCDGIYDCTDHSDEFNCIAGKGSGKSGSNSGSGNFKRWKKDQQLRRRSLVKAFKDRKLRKRSSGWSQSFLSSPSPQKLSLTLCPGIAIYNTQLYLFVSNSVLPPPTFLFPSFILCPFQSLHTNFIHYPYASFYPNLPYCLWVHKIVESMRLQMALK